MGSKLCCFKLELTYAGIYRAKFVPNTTPSAIAAGIEGPAGAYAYHLSGTAYGLGDLEEGAKIFESTIGGIAVGARYEGSSVVEAPGSTPYCPPAAPLPRDFKLLQKATGRNPSFSWALVPAVAGFTFGYPLPSASLCPLWTSWQDYGTNYPDPFRFIYTQLGGGLYKVKASAFKGFDKLYSDPGSATLICRELFKGTTVTNQEMGGVEGASFQALDVSLRFFPPDELKRQKRELKRMIDGTEKTTEVAVDAEKWDEGGAYFTPPGVAPGGSGCS